MLVRRPEAHWFPVVAIPSQPVSSTAVQPFIRFAEVLVVWILHVRTCTRLTFRLVSSIVLDCGARQLGYWPPCNSAISRSILLSFVLIADEQVSKMLAQLATLSFARHGASTQPSRCRGDSQFSAPLLQNRKSLCSSKQFLY